MYKKRITKWDFKRNNRETNVRALLRKQTQRSAVGKPSAFTIHGRPVNMASVQRYCKRKGIKLTDVASPPTTPVELRCFTPEPVTPPIRRKGLTDFHELILHKLSVYLTGSFEAGMWVTGDEYSLCRPIRGLGGEDYFNIYNLMGHLYQSLWLMDNGRHQYAGLYLLKSCVPIKDLLKVEPLDLIPCLVRISLDYSRDHPAVIKTVLMHFQDMAEIVYKESHPLNWILPSLNKLSNDGLSRDLASSIFSTAYNCMSRFLGAFHFQTIWLRVMILSETEAAGPYSQLHANQNKLWELLQFCNEQCGTLSPQSLRCLNVIGDNFLELGDLVWVDKVAQEALLHV
jgi:hypothetical protein